MVQILVLQDRWLLGLFYGPAQTENLKKGYQFGHHNDEVTDIYKMIKTKRAKHVFAVFL